MHTSTITYNDGDHGCMAALLGFDVPVWIYAIVAHHSCCPAISENLYDTAVGGQ